MSAPSYIRAQIKSFLYFSIFSVTKWGPLKIVAQILRVFDFRGEGPLAPKGGPADSGALANWFAPPQSKIPSAATGQGCGVGVEAGVGVGRSRPFRLESESELESIKFCRLRLWPGVARYQPSTGNDFGQTVMHRPKNIERQEENESVSVKIKLKRHLVIDFRLIQDIGDNFGVIAIAV